METPLTLQERSALYYWLAKIFRTEVDAEFLKALRENRAMLQSTGFDPGEAFFSMDKDALLEELAVAYTHLFIGPGQHISLMESVHRPDCGTYWGESTAEVLKIYRHYGLALVEGSREFPDHLAVCLEFMGKLTAHEDHNGAAEQQAERDACQKAQKKFLQEHLFNWVPAFCDQVLQATTVPFYQEAACLLKDFLLEEEKLLVSV